jgi:hypothetical protein
LGATVTGGDLGAVDVEGQSADGLGTGERQAMPGAVAEPSGGVDRGVRVAGAGPDLPGGVQGSAEVIDHAGYFGIQQAGALPPLRHTVAHTAAVAGEPQLQAEVPDVARQQDVLPAPRSESTLASHPGPPRPPSPALGPGWGTAVVVGIALGESICLVTSAIVVTSLSSTAVTAVVLASPS